MRRHFVLFAFTTLFAATVLALSPGTDLYLPAMAHIQGACPGGVCAQWRADVWIFNPSTTRSVNVEISFLQRDQPNPNPPKQVVAVGPGETRLFPDIITGTFGLTDVAGALRFVSAGGEIFVTGRSYDANAQSAKAGGTVVVGTAGQFFAGTPARVAIANGEFADIIGLDEQPDTWRSNVAFVETTGNTATLDISRLDASGTVQGALSGWSLRGRETRQLDSILAKLGATSAANQRVRVKVTSGTGKVLVAGSRIDSRTGDPSTVEMAGTGRDGAYICRLKKNNYDTALSINVSGNAVASFDAVILFTDEDVPTCANGELMRFSSASFPAWQPVVIDDFGSFSFVVSGTVGGLGVTMEFNGAVTGSGRLTGTVATTLSGAGGCSGKATWPLQGARIP